jgi:hypothetical protein
MAVGQLRIVIPNKGAASHPVEDQINRGQIQEAMDLHQIGYIARIGAVLMALMVLLGVVALSVSSEAGVQAVEGIIIKEGPVDNISSKEVVANKIFLKQL